MAYTKPKPGQPLDLIRSAGLWGDVVQVVNWYKQTGGGTGGVAPSGPVQIQVANTTANEMEFGEVLQLDALQDSTEDSAAYLAQPLFSTIDPVWHTAIDKLVPVQAGAVVDQVFPMPQGWAWVKINNINASHNFVMLDPDDVTQMKTAYSGVWKILGRDAANANAVVDLHVSQIVWRYEMKEASQQPNTTTCKLLNLDNVEFASDVEVSDPLGFMSDQSSGDQGYCLHLGNEFHAIQAVCV